MSILRMKDGGKTAEILVYDLIGLTFFEDGITAKSVSDALADAGNVETIEVRINSPGGNIADGTAIYNALHRHKARVVVEIDGHALSAASLIAMAGDEIRMAENAMMMIHEAWGMTRGNAADHEQTARMLKKMSDGAASVYAARAGLDKDEVLQLMAAETWFTAEDALEKGLATSVVAAKTEAQSAWQSKWQPMLTAFQHAPEDMRKLKNAPPPRREPPKKSNATPSAPQSSAMKALVPTALSKLASERASVRLGDLVRNR